MLNWAARYAPIVRWLDETNPSLTLDAGSGTYGITWQRPGRAVQTDLVFDGLSRGDDRPGEPIFVRASVDALPFRDDAFEAAISIDMMEHLPEGLRAPAVAEMARVASRRVMIGFPIGGAARWTDWAFMQFLRAMRRDRPVWLYEHRERGYPTRGTIRDALPDGWMIAREKKSNNVVALFAVLIGEAVLASEKRGWMPGRHRAWRWPGVLDRGPVYRRIYMLERGS